MNATMTRTVALVAQHLHIWFDSVLLLIGNIRCLMNIIVFRSKSFHKSSFSIYFLATTCADLVLLDFVLLNRILQNEFILRIFHIDFFIMVSIDRYLSTHPQVFSRSWGNQYSLAIRIIPCITLFWMIALTHRLVLYRIDSISGVCQAEIDLYWWYKSYLKFVFTGLAPPTVILTLSAMIIRNIRLAVKRGIVPTEPQLLTVGGNISNKFSRLQKLDSQLTSIFLIQFSVSFIFFLPYSSKLIYRTLGQNGDQIASLFLMGKSFLQFIDLTSYVFYATNAYIFLASSSLFRNELVKYFM